MEDFNEENKYLGQFSTRYVIQQLLLNDAYDPGVEKICEKITLMLKGIEAEDFKEKLRESILKFENEETIKGSRSIVDYLVHDYYASLENLEKCRLMDVFQNLHFYMIFAQQLSIQKLMMIDNLKSGPRKDILLEWDEVNFQPFWRIQIKFAERAVDITIEFINRTFKNFSLSNWSAILRDPKKLLLQAKTYE